MEHLDVQTQRFLINKFIFMDRLMDMLNIDYRVNSNMFCPFHRNENSPSAHYYSESNLLWCFSEQKMYGSYDLYKIYTDVNTEELAIKILSKFSDEQQRKLLLEAQEELEPERLPFEQSLYKFSHNKVSYDVLLHDIMCSLETNI